MSLTQALNSALSGLQVNQASIAMVAANVADAETPGYTRKIVNQVATGTSTSIGVRVSDIQREIDLYIQRQLRVENSGASYADTRARIYSQLQEIYGQPGSDTALESLYNRVAGTVDQPRRSGGPKRRYHQRISVDAAAQSVEHHDSGPAGQRGARNH